MTVATQRTEQTLRIAALGLAINTVLVVVKLVGGIVGNSYALIADAIESSSDVVGSIIVWIGLRIASRPPDASYAYGYGRAEPLTALIVATLLLGAAIGVATAAIREIAVPHHMPAPFTLLIVAGVVIAKEVLFRRVLSVAEVTNSLAVEADAWHHRSDALTSTAAFIGIAIALWGGPGWESADDWAALFASVIIFSNGARLIRLALADVMDRQPQPAFLEHIRHAAEGVPGVLGTEKLLARRLAGAWQVDLHVQADPALTLRESHDLGGRVRAEIREKLPAIRDVLVHMEPYSAPDSGRQGREATSVRT